MTVRFRSILVSIAILAPILVSAGSLYPDTPFTDVPKYAWFSLYVQQAKDLRIVNGYRDSEGVLTGKFGPGDQVTLAQALKIALLGAGYKVSDTEPTPPDESGASLHWASSYLSIAKQLHFKVFEDDPDLDRPATRAEVAKIFADAFYLDDIFKAGDRYADVPDDAPYAGAIEGLSTAYVLSGDTDAQGKPIGRFRPDDFINRAEVTKIVVIARVSLGTPAAGASFSMSSLSSLSATSTSSSLSSTTTSAVLVSNSSRSSSSSSHRSSSSLSSSVSSSSSSSSFSARRRRYVEESSSSESSSSSLSSSLGSSSASSAASSSAPSSSASSSSSSSSSSAQSSSAQVLQASVSIQSFQFSPSSLTVEQGTVVTWTNLDSASHTVTGNSGGPNSGTISHNHTYSYTFNTTGSFPYHCAFHPSMTGTITVTP